MAKKLPNLEYAALSELEEFKDVNFVVTDLDGTLVFQEDIVIKQLRAWRQKFQSKITITIATGRTYSGAKGILDQLEIKKGIPVVLYNGAVVLAYQTNEILYRSQISCDILEELCNFIDMDSQNLLAYCFDHDIERINDTVGGKVVETVYGFGRRTGEREINNLKVHWMSSVDKEITPCAVLLDKRNAGDKINGLMQYLSESPYVSWTDSGNGFFEIHAKNVNKGIIFDIFDSRKMLHIKKSMAIGDNDNDLELLRKADIGVVVANGSENAKIAADYVCEKKGAQGVMDLMAVLKAAKKYL